MSYDSVPSIRKAKMPVAVLVLAVIAICVAATVFRSPFVSLVIGVLACVASAIVAPKAKKRGALIAAVGLTLVTAVCLFAVV